MKRIIEQKNEPLEFRCQHCYCVFESDEYLKILDGAIEKCPKCETECKKDFLNL